MDQIITTALTLGGLCLGTGLYLLVSEIRFRREMVKKYGPNWRR